MQCAVSVAHRLNPGAAGSPCFTWPPAVPLTACSLPFKWVGNLASSKRAFPYQYLRRNHAVDHSHCPFPLHFLQFFWESRGLLGHLQCSTVSRVSLLASAQIILCHCPRKNKDACVFSRGLGLGRRGGGSALRITETRGLGNFEVSMGIMDPRFYIRPAAPAVPSSGLPPPLPWRRQHQERGLSICNPIFGNITIRIPGH